jgi:hypothetical protein
VAADVDQLTTLSVLHLDETPRARELVAASLYARNMQSDHLTVTWEGYKRGAGETYLVSRQRGLGFVMADAVPFGGRRPTCPTLIAGNAVDTYTALLLGHGRAPSVSVVGDEDSTDLLGAVLKHSDSWDSLGEARSLAGSRGCAAVVPEVIDGEPSLRALKPEHLYVEWTEKKGWVPSRVIEQKRVDIEHLDRETGKVCTARYWRTRAWDEEFAYVYEDALDTGDAPKNDKDEPDPDPTIKLAEDPISHNAGRCPVVWLQNTRNADGPSGLPDYHPVFEQIDQLNELQSMIMRGAKANADPTLVISDTRSALQRWPSREKGYGKKIEVTEKGSAKLLEISGKALETSWLTYDHVKGQVDQRIGVISPDASNAGAYQSGVALQILHRTQNTRAGKLRVPLECAIEQVCSIWLAMVRAVGITEIGSGKPGIELHLREIKVEESDDDEEKPGKRKFKVEASRYEPHTIGEGQSIALGWPDFHSPTPQDLLSTAQALGAATGMRPVMSQESAVSFWSAAAQTHTDPAEEMERIEHEAEGKLQSFEQSMLPDVELEDSEQPEVDAAAEQPAAGELNADGSKKDVQKKDVQKEAYNGAQVTALADTVARAGSDLSPEASFMIVVEGFPMVDQGRLQTTLMAQAKFIEGKQGRDAAAAQSLASATPQAAPPAEPALEQPAE